MRHSHDPRELVASTGGDPNIGIVVCIPSFRRPRQLKSTLQSLAGQRTLLRFAVVVVENDGLGRESAEVAVNTPFLDAVLYVLGISRSEIEAADLAEESRTLV